MSSDIFNIAGKDFSSRLLVGTGKYSDEKEATLAIEASEAEIVTVAIRRVELEKNKRTESIPVSYTHLTLPTNREV